MQKIELWYPVKGYTWLYEYSSKGRIRSLPKLIPANNVRGSYTTVGVVLSLNNLSPDGYPLATLYDESNKGTTKTAHWFIFYSEHPELSPVQGYEIDHDDNDKLNNRPDNLKLITCRANSSKRSLQHPKTSIYTGVYWDKIREKWHAQIKINKRSKSLGRFDVETDAAQAYNNKLASL